MSIMDACVASAPSSGALEATFENTPAESRRKVRSE